MKKYIPVQAVQDEDSHWYLIPNELRQKFRTLQEKAMADSDGVAINEFINIFDKYRTGGDVNNTQLYIESK